MNINRGPGAIGLQQMAARAQEVRKQLTPIDTPATPESGSNTAEPGKTLPLSNENVARATPHDTGLARAIERLQINSEKSPEAKGLLQALEKLQARLPDTTTIDTAA